MSLDSLEHVTTVSSIVCNEVAQLFKKKKKMEMNFIISVYFEKDLS